MFITLNTSHAAIRCNVKYLVYYQDLSPSNGKGTYVMMANDHEYRVLETAAEIDAMLQESYITIKSRKT